MTKVSNVYLGLRRLPPDCATQGPLRPGPLSLAPVRTAGRGYAWPPVGTGDGRWGRGPGVDAPGGSAGRYVTPARLPGVAVGSTGGGAPGPGTGDDPPRPPRVGWKPAARSGVARVTATCTGRPRRRDSASVIVGRSLISIWSRVKVSGTDSSTVSWTMAR